MELRESFLVHLQCTRNSWQLSPVASTCGQETWPKRNCGPRLLLLRIARISERRPILPNSSSTTSSWRTRVSTGAEWTSATRRRGTWKLISPSLVNPFPSLCLSLFFHSTNIHPSICSLRIPNTDISLTNHRCLFISFFFVRKIMTLWNLSSPFTNHAEPPERPVILDARRGGKTKLIEPYNEGSDVLLICEVSGGEL